jgi:hypothetical protein
VAFRDDFIIIPGVVFRDPNLSWTAKGVYGRLKLYAGKKGECYPKQETLAAEVCLKTRQLQKVLIQLRDAGWISWDRESKNCAYTVHDDAHSSTYHEAPVIRTGVRVKGVLECVSEPPLPIYEKNTEKNIPESESFELTTTPDTHHGTVNGTGRKAKLESVIAAAAQRIFDRQPELRRDCYAGTIRKRLRAILEYQRVPVNERESYVEGIDRRHAGWCATEAWTKDNGQFAKGLENWLAPTKERYLVEPPAQPIRKGPAPVQYLTDELIEERRRKKFEGETNG